jgi:hypothetical protein
MSLKKKLKLEYCLLALILLFAFFLRIYSLGNAPFWIDESISAIASKNILLKGVPVLDSGFYYSGAHFFQYPQALSMLIFGLNEFGARFASVIFGLLTIVLAYMIGKQYSKSGGIIAALFLSVFYLEVFFSRQARHYQLFQLMFFLTIYLLYKSKEKPKLMYAALAALIITIDTQEAGLILLPVFAMHFYLHRKRFFGKSKFFSQKNAFKYVFLAIITCLIAYRIIDTIIKVINSSSISLALRYASSYSTYLINMKYLVILFMIGALWAYMKKKELTLYMLAPSLILLIGVLFVKFFAFRYVYFFMFALVLYAALLFSFLYDNYKWVMIVPIAVLLMVPSNLVFPYTYVNVLKPVTNNFNDVTAPEINLRELPANITEILKDKENTVVVFFSPTFEWYIRKPDYVLPFSMNRLEEDSVSWNGVDRYSGAPMSNYTVERPFYLVADEFSTSKLAAWQREKVMEMMGGCKMEHEGRDFLVYACEVITNYPGSPLP